MLLAGIKLPCRKSPKAFSAKTKSDLWAKMAAKDDAQSENDLDRVTRDIELPLAQSPTRCSQLQQNVTFDQRWLPKMAANQKMTLTMFLSVLNYYLYL